MLKSLLREFHVLFEYVHVLIALIKTFKNFQRKRFDFFSLIIYHS